MLAETKGEERHALNWSDFLRLDIEKDLINDFIESEYDHIGFKIDIGQECIALRRPDDGEPVDCLSRSWNLDTGELEWPLVDTPFSQYLGDSFRGEILPTKIGFESNDKQLLK